ncbi:MAG: hypothetical protein Q8Q08_04425 [Candidatus Omnitrophota bacterium]|nr:hypothetical protein [Candidatus Omnitrophota bacterium]
MKASFKNIFKLLCYVALALVASLAALVIVLHLVIRFRIDNANRQSMNLTSPKAAASAGDLYGYAGQYELIEGNCTGPFFGPIFTFNPAYDTVFQPVDLNQDWAFKGHADFLTNVYTKRIFKGGKLRFIEKRGYNLFLAGVKEDLEIDFSGLPGITTKDRVRRTECKYMKK